MSIAPQKWVSNLVNQANAHTHTHMTITTKSLNSLVIEAERRTYASVN